MLRSGRWAMPQTQRDWPRGYGESPCLATTRTPKPAETPHRTPSATWGSNRYCGAQRALLRLNLPTSRSQPTGPGARAPADWLTRRASSFATSAQGRGGRGRTRTTPHPAFAPPRESARGRRRGLKARPKPMTLGPERRGNPSGAKRGRAITGRPRGWAPQTISGVLERRSP